MKKKLHFILMSVVVLLTVPLTLFSQPQYYNYQNVGTSSNVFPFAVTAGKQVQWLFLAGDFNMPSPAPSGNITTIYFYMTGTSSNTITNLTIKMGLSNITTLPAGVIYTGQLDTVYFRSSVTLNSTLNSWMSITLDRPFAYNNTMSLIVDVSQCGASSTTMSLRQNTLTPVRRNYVNAASCVFTYAGQDGNIVNGGVDIVPVCNNSWATQTSGTTNLLQAVSSVSRFIGWIAGASATVRRTTDGGVSWTNANPNPGVVTGDVYNIFATDANTCLLTTSPTATFIYRTTNGGTNWTQVFTQPGGFIDGIYMKDANTGFAYGDPVASRWSLWKTTNGGVNWDSSGLYLPQNSSEAGWNNAIKILGNTIWFGTNGTRVYYSTNFGTNWQFGATGDANSYGIQFNSATAGMVGGGVLNYTTNGGANYSTISAPGTGNINSMSGSLGSQSFWFSRGNNIYKSTNNGASWTTAFTGTQALWAMDLSTINGCPSGWCVGAAGTVVHLTNDSLVGIQTQGNQLPSSYKLEQNYPNPFNPSTIIKYGLPKDGHVSLIVYDLLGREVKVLADEYMKAGTHTIEFNAQGLASGVYFYTIKSDDYKETRKMLLIK